MNTGCPPLSIAITSSQGVFNYASDLAWPVDTSTVQTYSYNVVVTATGGGTKTYGPFTYTITCPATLTITPPGTLSSSSTIIEKGTGNLLYVLNDAYTTSLNTNCPVISY